MEGTSRARCASNLVGSPAYSDESARPPVRCSSLSRTCSICYFIQRKSRDRAISAVTTNGSQIPKGNVLAMAKARKPIVVRKKSSKGSKATTKPAPKTAKHSASRKAGSDTRRGRTAPIAARTPKSLVPQLRSIKRTKLRHPISKLKINKIGHKISGEIRIYAVSGRDNLVLDVAVDGRGLVKGQKVFLGLLSSAPFLVRVKGEVDFGGLMDKPGLHRRGETDVRRKLIRIGSSFSFSTEPVIESYRVGSNRIEKGRGPRRVRKFAIEQIEAVSTRKRLIAKCVEPNVIDPEVEYDLLIDVMLDKDGLVDSRLRCFGLLGKPGDVEVKPFSLGVDGTVDFGEEFIPVTIDLCDVAIRTGELFYVSTQSDRCRYRIDQVV
jgi:hypothetical protein